MKIASFIFITVFFCSCDLSGDSPEEAALFKKIKKGMTRKEVMDILGKPDTIIYSFDSTTSCYEYFSKNKSAMRSIMPHVSFSNDTVIGSGYSE